MTRSFNPDHKYVSPSRQDNPCMVEPSDKVSIAVPTDDWFCSEIGQMNLHLLQDHISSSGDFRLTSDQPEFKPPKSQARWYAMHQGPDPSVSRPGKLVNKQSGGFTRILKPLAGVSHTQYQSLLRGQRDLFVI